MIRVLHITADLNYHGTSKQLVLLASHLDPVRFQSCVAVLGTGGPHVQTLQQAGVRIEVLGWRRLLDWNPFRRLRQVIADYQPDVLHTWGWTGLRAALLARKLVPRVVASELRAGNAELRISDRWMLALADHLIVPDVRTETLFRKSRLRKLNLSVIPPAVERIDSNRSESVPFSGRCVVCVGPLEMQKGYQDAIWSADILNYLYDDLRLVLIGDGPDRWRLQQFARAVKREQLVQFTGSQPSVWPWLARAEVVWIPGRADRGLNCALEAMAAGCPVVASRVPSLAGLIDNGVSGLLVAPGDKVSRARKTRQLLEDSGLRRQMGEAGRQRVEQRHSVSAYVDRYSDLYESDAVST